MAEFNRNKNGVFGEIKLNGNSSETESTSFFESTIAGNDIFGVNNQNNEQKNNANNIFAGFETENNGLNFEPIGKDKAIAKQGLWSKVKSFLFQEIDLNAPIKVELTPYQQKIENEINDFLHQEITFKGIANFFKGKK